MLWQCVRRCRMACSRCSASRFRRLNARSSRSPARSTCLTSRRARRRPPGPPPVATPPPPSRSIYGRPTTAPSSTSSASTAGRKSTTSTTTTTVRHVCAQPPPPFRDHFEGERMWKAVRIVEKLPKPMETALPLLKRLRTHDGRHCGPFSGQKCTGLQEFAYTKSQQLFFRG